MFIVGAMPALVAGYIGVKVEESPAWQQGSAGRGTGMSLSGLWQGIRGYWPLFLFLVLLMSGFNAFSHGSQDLHPLFLQSDHHFDPHTVSLIGIVLALGAIAGGVVFGALSERWGRKRAIITAALLAIPAAPLAMLTHGRVALATGAFLVQFMVQGAWGVIPVYLSEISPGPVRATRRLSAWKSHRLEGYEYSGTHSGAHGQLRTCPDIHDHRRGTIHRHRDVVCARIARRRDCDLVAHGGNLAHAPVQ
jgi:SHS family lactate transporter-like MFS transporter